MLPSLDSDAIGFESVPWWQRVLVGLEDADWIFVWKECAKMEIVRDESRPQIPWPSSPFTTC